MVIDNIEIQRLNIHSIETEKQSSHSSHICSINDTCEASSSLSLSKDNGDVTKIQTLLTSMSALPNDKANIMQSFSATPSLLTNDNDTDSRFYLSSRPTCRHGIATNIRKLSISPSKSSNDSGIEFQILPDSSSESSNDNDIEVQSVPKFPIVTPNGKVNDMQSLLVSSSSHEIGDQERLSCPKICLRVRPTSMEVDVESIARDNAEMENAIELQLQMQEPDHDAESQVDTEHTFGTSDRDEEPADRQVTATPSDDRTIDETREYSTRDKMVAYVLGFIVLASIVFLLVIA